MRRLRQFPALLVVMTLVVMTLAVALGFVLTTTRLLAAPPFQASGPAIKGYYQSEAIPGQGDTPDLVVGLILYDDGAARVVSEYQNDSDVINEVGTWVDNGDNTATLTVTGTVDSAYAAPIDLDFQVADDGSLVVPGSATGAFGEAGLILVPTPFGNSTAILAQIPSDALAYQSPVMPSTTSPGLQLTLALLEDGSLTLISDYMRDDDIVVEIGKWTQGDDNTLNISLTGQIEDGNGQVTEYDAPLEFVFTVNDDDSLALVDEGGALFGPAGLSLAPIAATGAVTSDESAESVAAGEVAAGVAPEASEVVTDEVSSEPTEEAPAEATEAASAEATPEATATPEASEETGEEAAGEVTGTVAITLSGAYVSPLLPAGDEGGNFLVMLFNRDGSLYFTTYTLNGDSPLVEVGAWATNEDGDYTATVTGTVDDAYDAPIDVDFTVRDDGVINIADVNLYPLAKLDLANLEPANNDLASAPAFVAEFQSDPITYTVDPTHTLTLAFYDDNSAELTTEFEEGEFEEGEPTTQYGDWAVNESGEAITVTLTRDDTGDLDEPEVMLFDIGSEETLILSNDEAGYYGDEGLTLSAVEIDDAAALEEDSGTEPVAENSGPAAEDNQVDSGEEITATDGISGTEELTTTENVTTSEETTGEANIQIFQSEVLPSPSSPGLQLTLGMQDDGSAAIDYDYMNNDDVVTNTGTWEANDDGTITVTLTDGPKGALDLPVELTLTINDDGNWVISDASEESLGLVDVVLTHVGDQ